MGKTIYSSIYILHPILYLNNSGNLFLNWILLHLHVLSKYRLPVLYPQKKKEREKKGKEGQEGTW